MNTESREERRDEGAGPLRATPAVERLLDSLQNRLRRQVLLHGVGSLLALVAAWILFAFLADWGLRVPRPVRVLHGGVLVSLTAYLTWRHLVAPLLRLPERTGLAILLEKAHPELHQLLVSAVQLQRGEGAGDPALVERVLARAERAADELDARGVLEERAPRRRFLVGTAAAALLLAAGVAQPELAGILFDRMLGGARSWPQRTELAVDVPLEGPGVQIARSESEIRVRVARGSDVPVVVRADGVVPDEVVLRFDAGRDLVLSGTGGDTFRTLLRSCQDDVSFSALGGDDVDGEPRVHIEVLRPPDVEGLAIEVQPPAYSGLAPSLIYDRDVEVLRGSELAVHVLPSPREARGAARLLPADVVRPLVPSPYPLDPSRADEPGDVEGAERGWVDGLAFELRATEPVGFRIELVDGTGLSNPDPGLFRVRVVDDRPPEIHVLAPGRSEFEVVKGGSFPLRARVEDDFGIVSIRWSVRPESSATAAEEGEAPALLDEAFELAALEDGSEPGLTGPTGTLLRTGLGSARVEVDSLGTPDAPPTVDQRFLVQLTATDNRRPETGVGTSLPMRVRVVTPEELLRRMQERLAQVRLSALRLSDLMREKRRRVEDVLEALESDALGDDLALNAALGGQRRVLGDAEALARELAAITEDILYARLDEKAGALLEFYDARMAGQADFRFQPEPWRELALEHRSGRLGTSGFAGHLVELVDIGVDIQGEHSSAAVTALVEAGRALEVSGRADALERAIGHQTRSLERMDDLLGRLAEWDNFQNVLALTRDILNRQKALRERTQQFASEK